MCFWKMKKYNSTEKEKRHLRKKALSETSDPVIVETNGGHGRMYATVYHDIIDGVVFEKNPKLTDWLCVQRPTWSVYEGDCVRAITAGAGKHLDVNFLDVDPFGSPWDILSAWFNSSRPHVPVLNVVVNDGLRNKLKTGSAWSVRVLHDYVDKYGNDLYGKYLELCKVMLADIASVQKYTLTKWLGYYCGYGHNMTHYWATLCRNSEDVDGILSRPTGIPPTLGDIRPTV